MKCWKRVNNFFWQGRHFQMGTFITFSAEWEKIEQQRVDIGKMCWWMSQSCAVPLGMKWASKSFIFSLLVKEILAHRRPLRRVGLCKSIAFTTIFWTPITNNLKTIYQKLNRYVKLFRSYSCRFLFFVFLLYLFKMVSNTLSFEKLIGMIVRFAIL